MRAPIPPGVENPIAFYASARFFAVEKLLRDYEHLYVMDIDLQFSEDPLSFFRRLQNTTFAVPVSSNHNYLSPWRRYMAGN
ncbi:hypothetical protein, partial [Leptospira interrogans]|uniref:hypothetical protein n=1 Tax=Leptospira interrogans TaxID=173 RepID=UPI001C67D980